MAEFDSVKSTLLAAPTQVFTSLFEKFYSPNPDGATIFVNIGVSLKVALTGFLSAIIVGRPSVFSWDGIFPSKDSCGPVRNHPPQPPIA